MGKHRDWTEIEKDYLESGLSLSQLAQKYGVSISTLKKTAARQGWAKKRSGSEQKVERVETALAELEPEQMEPEKGTTGTEIKVYDRETETQRFNRIVNDMLDRVQDAICMVNPSDAASIKLLTAALKDLRSLKGLDKTDLDREEQRARIAKLRSDTRIVDDSDEGGVILMPEIQEVGQPNEQNHLEPAANTD